MTYTVVNDNNLDFNQDLSAGLELTIDSDGKGNETVKKYYSTRNIKVVNN